MATPFVTGVLALVRDLHPDWSYRQVIDRVLGTVDPLPAFQGITVTGGRLDAAAAIGLPVAPPVVPPPPALPPPAVGNVTAQFSFARQDQRESRHRIHSTITLRNLSNRAMAAPVFLALDGLAPWVRVEAADLWVTFPQGKRFVGVSRQGLAPGQQVIVQIDFVNKRGDLDLASTPFVPRILAGIPVQQLQ
jgi:hypothetical protein